MKKYFKGYWLIINKSGQPLVDVYDKVWIFWGKKLAISTKRRMEIRDKKINKKLERRLVKATILWQK